MVELLRIAGHGGVMDVLHDAEVLCMSNVHEVVLKCLLCDRAKVIKGGTLLPDTACSMCRGTGRRMSPRTSRLSPCPGARFGYVE